jgi:hypothetical protein
MNNTKQIIFKTDTEPTVFTTISDMFWEENFEDGDENEYLDALDIEGFEADEDFADYANGEFADKFHKGILRIEQHTDGWGYGMVHCTVDTDITDAELAELRLYIIGQLSDGIGSNLEQHAVDYNGHEDVTITWSGNWEVTLLV